MSQGVNRLAGRNNNKMDLNPDGSVIVSTVGSSITFNTDIPSQINIIEPPIEKTSIVIPNPNQTPSDFEATEDIIPTTDSKPTGSITDVKPTLEPNLITLENQFLPDIEENFQFAELFTDIEGIITSVIIEPELPIEGASLSEAALNNVNGWYNTFKDNNPFNMISTNIRWKGKIGFKIAKNSGLKFVVFDTLDNGIRAGSINLSGYFTRRKLKTIRQIINVYAPPGSQGQSAAATALYIKNVTDYFKQNFDKNTTTDTILSFNGYKETNLTNIKMFKTLVKAILKVEGKLTPILINTIDNFNISNLR